MSALSYQAPAKDHREQPKVLPFTHKRTTSSTIFPEVVIQEKKNFEISLSREELPLTIQYGDKTYILVLTKSNKLLLQKPLS